MESEDRPSVSSGVHEDLPSGPVVLATKLHPPAARSGVVIRERLVAQLSCGRRLTLVGAPAGWGKSTLLAHWRAASGKRGAWLSLDRADDDPRRFWTHVVAALRTVEPDVGAGALALLGAPGSGVVDTAVAILVNELGALDLPVTLILDDYHLVTDPSIHDGMAFFVEHLPPTVHLVVASRSDPPLPLARLRGRGELVEVRAADLRFRDEEAAALLNGALDLALPAGDVARLQARTEGWAAGLSLAALSLRGQDDPGRFIDDFAGDDRHVVDYLGSEVLAGATEEVRDFLLLTSVLDRLCGPLCDAVTDQGGSALMLERIERANFFLLPLDTRRRWYRYHQLFADLLRHELTRTRADLLPELHRRASAWCRDAGLTEEAIRHATAAGDGAEAGELVARHWLLTTDQGHAGTVFRWLDALPAATVAGDARLCLAQAMTLLSVGRPEAAPAWIDLAERAEPQGPLWDGMSSIEAEVAFARAMAGSMNGDLGAATAAAQRALELEESAASFWRTTLAAMTGAYLYLYGRGAEAVPLLERGIATDGTGGNGMSLAYALAFRAILHVEAGELEGAERVLARARGLLARDRALGEHFAWYAVELATGLVEARRGEGEAAESALERATELARRGGGMAHLAFCVVVHAFVRHRLGDRPGAGRLAAEARGLVAACPDPGRLLPARLTQVERLLGANGRPAAGSGSRTGAGIGTVVPAEALSERELAVLRLLASPLSLREVGSALYVSLNTVKTHTRALYRKLGAAGREEAVARARQLGLV